VDVTGGVVDGAVVTGRLLEELLFRRARRKEQSNPRIQISVLKPGCRKNGPHRIVPSSNNDLLQQVAVGSISQVIVPGIHKKRPADG
jgi:hypothetical protein